MDSELTILLIFGAVVAALLGLKATGMIGQLGMGYMLSSRDESRELKGMLGRADRALNNSLTALILTAPPILALTLRDQASGLSLITAQIFLAARLIYLPAYVFGIRGLRTLVWLVGYAATLLLYAFAL